MITKTLTKYPNIAKAVMIEFSGEINKLLDENLNKKLDAISKSEGLNEQEAEFMKLVFKIEQSTLNRKRLAKLLEAELVNYLKNEWTIQCNTELKANRQLYYMSNVGLYIEYLESGDIDVFE